MEAAQLISSLVLSLRKKANIRVRQPLSKIMIPVKDENMKMQLEKVSHLIKSEVNIKEIEFLSPDNNILVKNVKPNFKRADPRRCAHLYARHPRLGRHLTRRPHRGTRHDYHR